jgi:hypothetical protein
LIASPAPPDQGGVGAFSIRRFVSRAARPPVAEKSITRILKAATACSLFQT